MLVYVPLIFTGACVDRVGFLSSVFLHSLPQRVGGIYNTALERLGSGVLKLTASNIRRIGLYCTQQPDNALLALWKTVR